ncbi:MAG: DMT family transporter [Negativicutes bacterium]|nr:DMT family transporter [Negativicutes bacterium]
MKADRDVRNRRLAELSLLLITALWGGTFVTVKAALTDATPLYFVALRFTVAFMAMAAMYPGQVVRAARPGCRGVVVAAGLFLLIGYTMQTWGLVYTTPAKSGFITGFSVIITPLIARLWRYPLPDRATFAGIGCALIGLGLLTLDSGLGAVNLGDCLTLICAAAFAFQIVMVGHYARRIDPVSLAAGQIGVVAALSWPAALIIEPRPDHLTPRLAAAVLVTALLATVLAFLVQSVAQKYTSAARTALIFTAEPVFAGLFSWWFIGEWLAPAQMMGCLLILYGMVSPELILFWHGRRADSRRAGRPG